MSNPQTCVFMQGGAFFGVEAQGEEVLFVTTAFASLHIPVSHAMVRLRKDNAVQLAFGLLEAAKYYGNVPPPPRRKRRR